MSMTPVQNIVGVRFSKVGKIYHFDASHVGEVRNGDSVVVETSRGWQLGEIAQIVDSSVEKVEGDLKSVARLATPRDLLLRKVWQVRELDVVESAKKRAEEINLRNVKMISAEYSFDGSRLAIMFSSDTDDKVDLKSLRSDMQKLYTPTQVEMRQIGPRDVAKIIGGMGACGLEKRCCSAFLTDFSSISIRMAKEQGISLSPTEITGMCGRLRCCLIYEYETYTELRKGLPKRGKHVVTPAGEGKVLDVSPLQGTVRVEIPEVGVREFTRAELAGETEPAFSEFPDGTDESVGPMDSRGEIHIPAGQEPREPRKMTDNRGQQRNQGQQPGTDQQSGQSQRHGGRTGRRRRGGRRD